MSATGALSAMKILLGLCGVGLGHATRAKVVIHHLARQGHRVLVAAAGQTYPFLELLRTSEGATPFDLAPLVGFGMHCEAGALDLRGSVELNARSLPDMLAKNAEAWEVADRFTPDVVITDFDSFAWSFARSRGLPLLSLDNGQIVRCCAIDPFVSSRDPVGFRFLSRFNSLIVPDADHYIVTSFFFPPPRPEFASSVTLVPAILRPEVVQLLRDPPRTRDHVLVYKTASLDDETFMNALACVPMQRFIVYGLRTEHSMPPNVERRAFSEAAFIRDLATARAIISNGGMSMLGEAIAFRKPVLAVPVRGQYEQEINAAYLEHLGLGASSPTLEPAELTGFLERVPQYEARLRGLPDHDRNARLYASLDALFPPARTT